MVGLLTGYCTYDPIPCGLGDSSLATDWAACADRPVLFGNSRLVRLWCARVVAQAAALPAEGENTNADLRRRRLTENPGFASGVNQGGQSAPEKQAFSLAQVDRNRGKLST